MDAVTRVGNRVIWLYVSPCINSSEIQPNVSPKRLCPNAGFQPPAFGAGRGAIPARGGFSGGFRGGFAGGVGGGPRPATCYKCGGPNHYARDCQAQAMKCYACGKLVSGHSEENNCAIRADRHRVTSRATAPPPMVVHSIPQESSATNVVKLGTSPVTALPPRRMVRCLSTALSRQHQHLHLQRLSPKLSTSLGSQRSISFVVL